MSWNYRVLHNKVPGLSGENPNLPNEYDNYVIHSVYYNGDGISIGFDPVTIEGYESISDLTWDLQKMLEAATKPVLDYESACEGILKELKDEG